MTGSVLFFTCVGVGFCVEKVMRFLIWLDGPDRRNA